MSKRITQPLKHSRVALNLATRRNPVLNHSVGGEGFEPP